MFKYMCHVNVYRMKPLLQQGPNIVYSRRTCRPEMVLDSWRPSPQPWKSWARNRFSVQSLEVKILLLSFQAHGPGDLLSMLPVLASSVWCQVLQLQL